MSTTQVKTTANRSGGGIAGFSMNNAIISWMITLILLVGGIVKFFDLGQLEDPGFTIKSALVITLYPGANSQQVEEDVTHVVETAIQKLPVIDEMKSWSSTGLSIVQLKMVKEVQSNEVQQYWDALRRKMHDIKVQLPKNAHVIVNDDFGDVFGMMMNFSGDGYDLGEVKRYLESVKRELTLVEGVGKVSILGDRQEQVFVELDRTKMLYKGLGIQNIAQAFANQNVISDAGDFHFGEEIIRFHPTGEINSVEQLQNLILSPTGSKDLIYLSDIANVYKGFIDKPSKLITINGKDAITLGISAAPGTNVVTVGKNVQTRLQELEALRPHGIDFEFVYNQPEKVEKSVSGFMGNLLEACVIIFFVLLFTMGRKAGLLISFILVVTIAGTFILMEMQGIQLQRISLGALIIALGMLIDNAIVIVEGLIIGMEKGRSKWDSMISIVKQTQYPLLVATLIAILAFAPIGLSKDSIGELLGSLFWVLCFSLFLSWFTAVTITPFFCDMLYKDGEFDGHGDHGEHDPYGGIIFRVFKVMLDACMRFPWVFTIILVIMLVIAGKSFKQIKPEFFPPSTVTQFTIDIWDGFGTDIRTTADKANKIEQFLLEKEEIVQVTSAIGGGHMKFMLPYMPEKHFDNFTQMLVTVKSTDDVVPMIATLNKELPQLYPELTYNPRQFAFGPALDAAIEVRISGADPLVLRQLSAKAKDIFRKTPHTIAVRDNWMARGKVIRPQFNEVNARRLGITKKQLDAAIKFNFSGQTIGAYKEGTTTLPVVARPPEHERQNIDNLGQVNIWSPVKQDFVQIAQIVDGFDVEFEDAYIMRRDRKRTISVWADADPTVNTTAATVRRGMLPEFEKFEAELPVGYTMEWGGKYETSTKAKTNVGKTLPLGYLAMFILTILLFNSVKKGLVIWFVVPLSIIGVVGGLLLFDMPFTFMSLLGALSLTGMMCRNGIVLVDQIGIYQNSGADDYKSIFDGAVSRVRPVSLTAIAAILGMIPLLKDAFFQAMAASMMVGLAVATFLILFAVPVFYMLIYRIKYRPLADIEAEGSLE